MHCETQDLTYDQYIDHIFNLIYYLVLRFIKVVPQLIQRLCGSDSYRNKRGIDEKFEVVFIDLLRNGVDDFLVPFFEQTTNEQHYFPLNGKQTATNRFFLCLFEPRDGDDPFKDIEEVRVAKTYLILQGWILTDLDEEVQNGNDGIQQVFFYLIAAECAYLQLSLRKGGQL